MKIVAVSTLYNPQPTEVWKHIQAYLPWVDKLVLWDNSPTPVKQEVFRMQASVIEWNKVLWMGGRGNMGIGVALNEALAYAQREGYDKLLTMDQDSLWFNFNIFLHEVEAAQKRGFQPALFVPVYTSGTVVEHPQGDATRLMNWFYTSGSLFDVESMQRSGPFRADFFVDGIDTEYTYRLRRCGIPIVRLNHSRLLIRLGNPVTRCMFGHLVTLPNRPPERLYGIFRNHLIACLAYLPDTQRELRYYIKKYLWGYMWRILLFETDKRTKLSACLRGFWSGLHLHPRR